MRQRSAAIAVLAVALLTALALWQLAGGSAPAPSSPPAATANRHTAPLDGATDTGIDAATPPEQVGAERAAGTHDGVLVRVSDEHHAPHAGARVRALVFDAPSPEPPPARDAQPDAARSGPGRARSTDAAGCVRMPRGEALLVLVANRLPVYGDTATVDDEVEVTVSNALLLAGRVLVGGSAPGEPMPLEAFGFGDVTEDWPSIARLAAAESGVAGDRIRVDCDANGFFQVRGLPPVDTIALRAPDQYCLPGGGEPVVTVAVASGGVTLELERARTFTVRTVADRDAGPAPSDLCVDVASAREQGEPRTRTFATRLGESVDVPLCEGLRSVEIIVRPRDATSVLARSWHDAAPAGSEITVAVPDATIVQVVRVVDADGTPIETARAAVDGDAVGPAAADGVLALPLRRWTRVALVGAPGYATVELPSAWPAAAQRTVVLQPANRLDVSVRADGPVPLPARAGLRVLVHGGGVDPLASRLRASPRSELGDDGTWSADDWPAGVPLEVALFDRYGYRLRMEVVQLAAGERRQLTWSVTELPSDVRGRVVTPDGAPIAGAAVQFGWSMVPVAHTNASGNFAVPCSFTPNPVVRVDAPGHVVRTIDTAELASGKPIALVRARTIRVLVSGAAGPADVEAIRFGPQDGGQHTARRDGPGRYVLHRVPCRSGTIRSEHPVASVLVDAEATEAELRIPSTKR